MIHILLLNNCQRIITSPPDGAAHLSLPDVVIGLVVVAVQDGCRQAEELQLLPPGLVVVEGVELHGGLHQQLGLSVALHLAQCEQAAHQQLPPVLSGQDVCFT